MRALVDAKDARAVDTLVRGRAVTAVYRPVQAQRRLREGGRTLGSRLGVYQLLQTLPLGEWVPLEGLTERERSILPALPTWTRRRRSGRVLRLADAPVRLEALLTRADTWVEALDGACALGRVAPRMAVCPPLLKDRDRACWEADFYGVGLAECHGEDVRVLVNAPTDVPETVAALHWRLAEYVHRVVVERETSSGPVTPVPQ